MALLKRNAEAVLKSQGSALQMRKEQPRTDSDGDLTLIGPRDQVSIARQRDAETKIETREAEREEKEKSYDPNTV